MLRRSAAPGKLAAQWQVIGMSKSRQHRCREMIQVMLICSHPCVEPLMWVSWAPDILPWNIFFCLLGMPVLSSLAPVHGLFANVIVAVSSMCP